MVKEYWRDNHGVIYHGDCLELMKTMDDNSVDLVLTDPPYGLGSTNFVTARRRKRKEEGWNNSIPSKEVFNEIYRISKNQIIWGCNYFFDRIISPGRIVHYKEMTSHNGPLKLSDCDLASQSFDRRIRYFHYQWSGNVQNGKINWKNEGPDARRHPTQKPLALMKFCLHEYTKKGDLILDPFLGSGTTARAAKDLGRRYIGCELEEKYCKIAAQRLGQEVLF